MNDPIIWYTKQVKIADLKNYEHNPRRMSKKDFNRLVNDIKQDGYRNRIVVDSNNLILAGHSRKEALIQAGFTKESSIDVLFPSRTLNASEIKRINIRDNLPFGEFDFDILGNHFEPSDLLEWGVPHQWVTGKDESDNETDIKQLETKTKLCKKCPYKGKDND